MALSAISKQITLFCSSYWSLLSFPLLYLFIAVYWLFLLFFFSSPYLISLLLLFLFLYSLHSSHLFSSLSNLSSHSPYLSDLSISSLGDQLKKSPSAPLYLLQASLLLRKENQSATSLFEALQSIEAACAKDEVSKERRR